MLAIAILAAGKGTRMKSNIPKVLHPLAGKTLLERVLTIGRSLQPDRQLVIVGYGSDQVRAALPDPQIEFVEQREQLGTGHAIQQLLPHLQSFTGDLVVLTGDSPLLRQETVQQLLRVHRERQADATVLTAFLPDPKGYGRVFCDAENRIECIIEDRDCTNAQRQNRRVNAGVYCFNWQILTQALPKLTTNNDQKEYYLTEVFHYMPAVYALDVEDYEESLGINDRQQLAYAYEVLQKRLRQKWMEAGVTMLCPETITIEDDVQLEANVTIEPHTHLRGKTYIGADTIVGPNSLIQNSHIGHNCEVRYSVVMESTIGDNCRVGPFAHIRGYSQVGAHCRIGNFVELKHTTTGHHTNAAHLSYLGDATIGSQVNIGAGTITANYDGFAKHPTVMGDRVKTGCHSVLIAPVQVADNTTIAAGTVVDQDVPPNSLVIGRVRAEIKADYYDCEGRKRATNAVK
ncbi:MAG: bifunctional UDP-N-acetylglucosamine diphosphorylase/glucosamine-1-phosphate N-acetyltransferase GlmU [Pseudanabaenaceae cyanobacterium SKYGB_i_bin29]|nr:bifunctional UDP-N-acetylglucosamine diphosphorylase/glucosamine-1-phosphate N-acetyltransferase GlmU [Pseudanabaenaceae cyanobacterium SKYG29]MDW8420555.1 bifunctional UDP-N-acetylglucosamine diphosphorylase/glucosamine-1-phosphate N-acetyltransferase GlmU [Pseudanabaenaceae cyanobacterium SKYGB_i_bin29]